MDKQQLIRNKLSKSTVGIAGLGGLGSNAAMALARAGVGRLVLIDFDIVERGNLNRQAYSVDQVGLKKTIAIKENITAANPNVNVDIMDLKLEPGKMDAPFHHVDVVVEALDSAETKAMFIEEILLKLPSKPLVAASGVAGYGNSGRVRTMISGNLHIVTDDQARSSEKDVLLAPKVGLFAYWQANIVLEILLEGLNDH